MTPSELKRKHEAEFPCSPFFSRENMRFAGDTMKNYGVRKVARFRTSALYAFATGSTHVDVWELYRKKPVKNGLRESAYFDQTTFKRVYV